MARALPALLLRKGARRARGRGWPAGRQGSARGEGGNPETGRPSCASRPGAGEGGGRMGGSTPGPALRRPGGDGRGRRAASPRARRRLRRRGSGLGREGTEPPKGVRRHESGPPSLRRSLARSISRGPERVLKGRGGTALCSPGESAAPPWPRAAGLRPLGRGRRWASSVEEEGRIGSVKDGLPRRAVGAGGRRRRPPIPLLTPRSPPGPREGQKPLPGPALQ